MSGQYGTCKTAEVELRGSELYGNTAKGRFKGVRTIWLRQQRVELRV